MDWEKHKNQIKWGKLCSLIFDHDIAILKNNSKEIENNVTRFVRSQHKAGLKQIERKKKQLPVHVHEKDRHIIKIKSIMEILILSLPKNFV